MTECEEIAAQLLPLAPKFQNHDAAYVWVKAEMGDGEYGTRQIWDNIAETLLRWQRGNYLITR